MPQCRSLCASALAGTVCLLLVSAPVLAQNSLLERAKGAARKTELGKGISRTALEAQMLDSKRISVEDKGLSTLPVGSLTFGIAAIEVKNDVGVRLHAYLLNPGTEAVSIPVPDPELFVLVDSKGRRLERVSGPSVEGTEEGASEITVPAMERVLVTLLFDDPKADGPTATLKVGSLGMISGIPVHTSAAGSEAGAGSVWSPSAPRRAAPADTVRSIPTPGER